jgi:cytidine deaminase
MGNPMPLKLCEVPDETAREMLRRADAAKVNAYPGGSHGYAVSVLTDKGNIYEGVSYKSDTYTLTMHCEMTALAHAAIHGEHNIVAITGPNCHMCKQLIWESALNSGVDTQIIMQENGEISRVPISSLMQYPWPDEKRQH